MRYNLSVSKSQLNGEISLVFSKSISNRVLIIKSLTENEFQINNLSDSNDTIIMQNALNKPCDIVNVEDAGTCMRFLTAFFAYKGQTKILQCSQRMKQRPIGKLVDALRKLGAKIKYLEKEGYPPLHIHGGRKLMGGSIEIDGNTSSQYISALMLIAPLIEDGLKIILKGHIVSRPYIHMTKKIMQYFGADIQFDDNNIIIKQQSYKAKNFNVEADWSAASYWFAMLALAEEGRIKLKNLYKTSFQGDILQISLFEKLGITTIFENNGLSLIKNKIRINKLKYDFVDMPDLAQSFAVCCAFLNIPFIFKGLETLRIKETDRINALINELKKFGYILSSPDKKTLIWDGYKTNPQQNIEIDTYNDHRMAMAFAPVIFKTGILKIKNPEVTKKSYPNFWEDLKKIGVKIEAY